MPKLFSIKEDQIRSSISPSKHFTKNGIWSVADGINPLVDAFGDSSNAGLLQTSSAPVDITSTVVVDNILASAAKITGDTTGSLYMLGSAGHFYDLSLSSDTAPTDLRSGTPITTPANGMAIFKPKNGTEYLYYWQYTQIGRWDLAGSHPTGWTDNYIASSGSIGQSTYIQSTAYHPTHVFGGDLYYGNKSSIGALLDDNAGGVIHDSIVLEFPGDYVTLDLDDDGTYLVAAITKNITSRTLQSDTRIIFWDTYSPTWNREWVIPDYALSAIAKFGNGFIAVCGRGIWYFSFYSKPKKIRSLSSSYVPPFGSPQAVDTLGDAIMWGGTANINSYGKITPEDDNVYRTPLAGTTANSAITFLDTSTRLARVYAGTAGNKLFYYTTATGGGTGYSAKTVYIPLNGNYEVDRIDFLLGEPLSGSDVLTVQVQGDEDTAASDWATLSVANNEAVKFVSTFGNFTTDQLKLILTFTAGNVKIKQIDVYGKRVSAK